MRVFSLLAVLLGSSVFSTASRAEVFVAESHVAEVTIHPSLALITRRADVVLPAGRHRIELAGIPYDDVRYLRVLHPGAKRLGLYLREGYPTLVEPAGPATLAAKARVKEVEDQIAALELERDRSQVAAEGASTVLDFVGRLGAGSDAALPKSEELKTLLELMSTASADARETILDGKASARRFEAELDVLEQKLAREQAELAALSQERDEQLFVALDVEMSAPGSVPVMLTYPSWDVEWSPAYEWHLEMGEAAGDGTGATRPKITLRRDVMVFQETGENWTNVALRVSTSTPDQQTAAGDIRPRRYVIKEEPPLRKFESTDDQRMVQPMASLAEPIIEAPVIIEEAASALRSETDVTYEFADLLNVQTGQGLAMFSLPDVTLETEIFAKVVPLRGAVAYRTARIENTSGEELLPAEQSLFFVDGVLVGSDTFEGLLAGDTVELGFGPIDGLNLRRDLLDRSEGERGVISRSNQRLSRVEIELENTTGRSWPVQLFDRVPYSEQEDLEITWTASPEVDIENHEKRRGILGWELVLPKGEKRSFTLETEVSWPEGYVLQ